MDFHWTHLRGPNVGLRIRVRKNSPVNTRRGAEEFERILRARLFDGLPLDGSDPKVTSIPTFAAFADEFLASYVAANNKPSVQKEKKCIFQLHLTPRFGPMRLDLVREREIELFKAGVLKTGITAKRLKNILAVLSKMLHYAEEVGVIERAPRVRMPKIAPSKFDHLTDDEYKRLRDAAHKSTHAFAMIVVAGDAGLRKGEILGLEWGDIDFVAKTLTVRRSVWSENRDEVHVAAPKSGRDRKIPMTNRLNAALRAHRHLRGERVFCNEDGSSLTPGQMEVVMRTACRRAGLRPLGWHPLRHTFASHLAQRGASPKAIQELLGHSEMGTTMRYMHLAPAHHREAIALLDAEVTRHSDGLGSYWAVASK